MLALLAREAELLERLGVIEIEEMIVQTASLHSKAKEISEMPRDAFERTVMDTLGKIERLESQIEIRLGAALH